MEIANKSGPVSIVGGGESSNFRIAMNAKAFRVLSDNLYQDKIGSIVRELSCNAADSHTMAGVTKPIAIHVPDQFEPWFTVRDFGIGLSPDSIANVFCVYFESTKDQSNDSIGAFGLGAKTPFAYSDQFSVISIFNGVKRSYSASIGASGMPTIDLMHEGETTDGNGVEIRMAVKEGDFNRFITAVKQQLRFFPVKPEISNFKGDFEFQAENEALFETPNVKVFKQAGYGARVHIIQGPVGYPLDFAQVQTHLDTDEQTFLRTLQEVGGNLYFKIGEIGVTASREGVEYNAHTIASLKAKITLAHSEIVAWINKEIASQKTAFDKAVFVNENSAFRSIINGVNIDLSPARKDSSGKFVFEIGNCAAFVKPVSFDDMTGKKVTVDKNVIQITEYTNAGVNNFSGSRNTTSDATLIPKSNMRIGIVLRDTGSVKTPVARMKHFFKQSNFERMYSLQPTVDGFKFDAKFVKALSAHLGGFANITLVSDMPEPPKTAYDRSRTNYQRPTAYQAAGRGSDDMDSVASWDRSYDKLDEMDDGGVYIMVERQRTENVPYEAKRLFNELCRAGVVDKTLYGIRENDLDKIKNNPEWVTLEAYTAMKKAEVMRNKNIRRFAIANNIKQSVHRVLGHRIGTLEGVDTKTALGKLIDIRERATAVSDKAKVNSAMLSIAGYDSTNHPLVKAVDTLTTKLYDGIPLARNMGNGYGTFDAAEAAHIVEYINHFAPRI